MSGAPQRLILAPGDTLFAEGDAAGATYLIVSGRVEIAASRGGAMVRLGERNAGDIVGESGVVDASPRLSSAVAVTACDLLVISTEDFSRRVEVADPVLRLCVGALLDRQGKTTAMLRAHATGLPATSPPSRWSGHFTAARDLLFFETQLRQAIETEELVLYFQPIVHLATHRLAGFEALLRWRHPQRGLILPEQFIPNAEAMGVITDITTYCFRRVGELFPPMSGAAALVAPPAAEPLFVSINISAADLDDDLFPSRAVSILSDAGIDPRHVRLEVTESVLVKDHERGAETLRRCRQHGMQVAIDDFGTGFSSLNYLNALPVEILKLDRSFAHGLLADPTGRKIIAGILHLGGELGLRVIAEGIEKDAEAEALAAMGCDFGQGFLFGPACDHAETLALIAAWIPGRLKPAAPQSQAG